MRTTRTAAVRGPLTAFFLAMVSAAGAQTPTVSPDPLPDVPPGSPLPAFEDYSWRSFIALNWPALGGAANRGKPDTAKSFGDVAGPRVWMTWKSRYEIFQPGGAAPSAFTSYDGQNPCGTGFTNERVTLSSFTAFGDFNQADFSLSTLGNPLVARNQTYARYDVRVNRAEFDSIVGHRWYLAANLPTAQTAVPFDVGSTEIKAAWRILTDTDSPAVRSRYLVVENAQVFDVAAGKCVLQDIALVGLHIVTKTPSRPQWIWSSFEHVDNVPAIGTEPTPPAGVPLSFNDPAKPQALDPPDAPPPVSPANPPSPSPTAMQVIRKQAISPVSMAMNRAYWALPQIKGTVWENYMLVMTQWPTQPAPESPTNNGAPFPSAGTNLSNTTMETYFQDDGSSCMNCHTISNRRGRDFVMFVTFDAFRPPPPTGGTPAPAAPAVAAATAGDLFALKNSRDAAASAGAALSRDPMIEELAAFFAAAKGKKR